jgi:hypothetical protein
VSILELNVKNLSRTLLTQDIGLTETSFTVADAGALPDPPFLITVEGEIMRVGSKNVSTNTLSNVLRGREGTSPTPHSSGTVVENRFTAGTYDEIKQTVTSCNNALTSHLADGASHSKTARFIVGTSTAGWTLEDCDYLCDGANDHVEINQAISALPEIGGKIVLLDGEYYVKDILLKDNITLEGQGRSTVLRGTGTTPSAIITPNEGVVNVEIKNIFITGFSSNGIAGRLIKSRISNVYVSNCSFGGIRLWAVDGVENNNNIVSECFIEKCNTGIYVSSHGNLIINNILKENNTDGLYASEGNIVLVGNRNIVQNNLVDGGNGDETSYRGVNIYNGEDNIITNNDLRNAGAQKLRDAGTGTIVDAGNAI